MKRLLMLTALVALLATACTKEETPSVSFTRTTSVLMADSPLEVEMTISAAATASISVPVTISGSAVKNEEYTISSEKFTFAAGSTKATVEITPNKNFTAEKDIVLTITPPAGYVLGENPSMVVAVEKKESIIYSFSVDKADLLDTYDVTLNLSGETTGENFTASTDMEIPFKVLEGSTAVKDQHYQVVGGKDVFTVKAGTNKATVSIKALDLPLGEEIVLNLGVDAALAGGRFLVGNTQSISISVKGVLKGTTLAGVWEFVEVPELEEWSFWVEDMGDDPNLMPVKNEGYRISFTYEDNVLKLIPGSVKGDLSNILRESVLTYSAPVNPAIGYKLLGPYSTEEAFFWGSNLVQLTYFSMDKANRAFSADTETIGSAVVAMRINSDGNLEFITKDYDEPPFMPSWWGGFDADMFGFYYIFKRVE